MKSQKNRNTFGILSLKHGTKRLLLGYILLLISLPLILFASKTIQEKISNDKIINDRGSIDDVSQAFN